jgi:hypothetical protein
MAWLGQLFFVAHEDQTHQDAHACDESHRNTDDEDNKITHFIRVPKRLPKLRMLGTQIPTKIACCRLRSLSPINQSVTLKTKLMNAAKMKKY